jgi:hypothetical protein
MGEVIRLDVKTRKRLDSGTRASSSSRDADSAEIAYWRVAAEEAFNSLEWEWNGRCSDYAGPVCVYVREEDLRYFAVELKTLMAGLPYACSIHVGPEQLHDGRLKVTLRPEPEEQSSA